MLVASTLVLFLVALDRRGELRRHRPAAAAAARHDGRRRRHRAARPAHDAGRRCGDRVVAAVARRGRRPRRLGRVAPRMEAAVGYRIDAFNVPWWLVVAGIAPRDRRPRPAPRGGRGGRCRGSRRWSRCRAGRRARPRSIARPLLAGGLRRRRAGLPGDRQQRSTAARDAPDRAHPRRHVGRRSAACCSSARSPCVRWPAGAARAPVAARLGAARPRPLPGPLGRGARRDRPRARHPRRDRRRPRRRPTTTSARQPVVDTVPAPRRRTSTGRSSPTRHDCRTCRRCRRHRRRARRPDRAPARRRRRTRRRAEAGGRRAPRRSRWPAGRRRLGRPRPPVRRDARAARPVRQRGRRPLLAPVVTSRTADDRSRPVEPSATSDPSPSESPSPVACPTTYTSLPPRLSPLCGSPRAAGTSAVRSVAHPDPQPLTSGELSRPGWSPPDGLRSRPATTQRARRPPPRGGRRRAWCSPSGSWR